MATTHRTGPGRPSGSAPSQLHECVATLSATGGHRHVMPLVNDMSATGAEAQFSNRLYKTCINAHNAHNAHNAQARTEHIVRHGV